MFEASRYKAIWEHYYIIRCSSVLEGEKTLVKRRRVVSSPASNLSEGRENVDEIQMCVPAWCFGSRRGAISSMHLSPSLPQPRIVHRHHRPSSPTAHPSTRITSSFEPLVFLHQSLPSRLELTRKRSNASAHSSTTGSDREGLEEGESSDRNQRNDDIWMRGGGGDNSDPRVLEFSVRDGTN